MEWKDEYNIGVEIVDKAHKQLFSIVRRIMNLLNDGDEKRRRFACQEGIKFFKSYTAKHFAEEEAYMLSIGYDGYEQQRAIHESLKNQTLPVLEAELEASKYSDASVEHFLGVCIGWLTTHIMIEDKAITGKSVQLNWNRHPGSEISAVKEMIALEIQQTFGLESTLMNEHYAGWDLRDPLYYELQYADENGEKLAIIMVMEERLALESTGQMLGMNFSEVNNIVVSAIKQIIRSFVHRIANAMGDQKQYRFTGDQMLNGKIFMERYRERPFQYSMLYATHQGYYVFCIDRAFAPETENAF